MPGYLANAEQTPASPAEIAVVHCNLVIASAISDSLRSRLRIAVRPFCPIDVQMWYFDPERLWVVDLPSLAQAGSGALWLETVGPCSRGLLLLHTPEAGYGIPSNADGRASTVSASCCVTELARRAAKLLDLPCVPDATADPSGFARGQSGSTASPRDGPVRGAPENSEAQPLANASELFRTALEQIRLSPRQREVALAIAAGNGIKETAERLNVQPETVKYHLARVCRAIGVEKPRALAYRLVQIALSSVAPAAVASPPNTTGVPDAISARRETAVPNTSSGEGKDTDEHAWEKRP